MRIDFQVQILPSFSMQPILVAINASVKDYHRENHVAKFVKVVTSTQYDTDYHPGELVGDMRELQASCLLIAMLMLVGAGL